MCNDLGYKFEWDCKSAPRLIKGTRVVECASEQNVPVILCATPSHSETSETESQPLSVTRSSLAFLPIIAGAVAAHGALAVVKPNQYIIAPRNTFLQEYFPPSSTIEVDMAIKLRSFLENDTQGCWNR